MPRNGSGGYSPPLNSWNPAVNGAEATPADWQAVLNDLAAAIQGSTAADGQTPITGVWNFANNRIAGVGAPTEVGNALRWEQLTKGTDIASAATISIPNEGALFEITGTTGITTINDTYPGRAVLLRFQDAVTLTHSSGLITPTGQTETTEAGDILGFVNSDIGVWSIFLWPRILSSGRLLNVQYFTSSGSYTPTAGTKRVLVEVVGGGGGGGAGNIDNSFGGGGAGGGYARKMIDVSTLTVPETVTIGAGGAAGTSGGGSTGGTTSFGGHVSANGGAAGASASGGGYAAGGSGVGGDMNITGGTGDFAGSAATYTGGRGGCAAFYSNISPGSILGSGGVAGNGYGAGGGGGGRSTGTTRAGADGTAGLCIVWERT
ncbi:MAG: hypothetical protein CL536_02465 [Alcaligenaceae bacterium]|nr:hypothetical protein [Alcaligenaceae bacterium]